MKIWKTAILAVLVGSLLPGCGPRSGDMERCLRLRSRLLGAQGAAFEVDIRADYGDKVHTFSLQCQADREGTVTFTVTKPESIAQIRGQVDGTDGALSFDDTALHFPLLADNQLTPVAAPWVLLKTLRTGCITSAGAGQELLQLSIDDSYADDALHLDIWLDRTDAPVRAEILFRERKILSLDVKNFTIL